MSLELEKEANKILEFCSSDEEIEEQGLALSVDTAYQLIRYEAKTNLYYLCTNFLEYNDFYEPLHGEMCNKIQAPREKQIRLWLVPRGHFKTSIITFAQIVQKILNNPDIKILICSATAPNAQFMVGAIRNVFMYNKKMRLFFPEFCPRESQPRERWGTEGFVSPARNKDLIVPEGTVDAIGIDSNAVSRHYDHIFHDDLVTKDNVKTAEGIQKVNNFFDASISLLNSPGDPIDIIGTRWDVKELYGDLIDSMWEEIDLYRKSAYDEFGEPIFPTRFTKEILERIKRKQGIFMFSCLYLNNPSNPDTQIFKRNYFKYFNTFSVLPQYGKLLLTVDPATGKHEKTDPVAMTLAYLSIDSGIFGKKIHVIDYYKKVMNPSEAIDKMVDFIIDYRVDCLGIEENAMQWVYKFFAEQKMNELNLDIDVIEVKIGRRSKTDRVRSLEPYYRNGRVYHIDKLKNTEFEKDIVNFGYTKDDHLPDALAMQLLCFDQIRFPIEAYENIDQEEIEEYNIDPDLYEGIDVNRYAKWYGRYSGVRNDSMQICKRSAITGY